MNELRIKEITPGFGAMIDGWSPGPDLDAATIGQLRSAFDEYQVLVFRDLDLPADAQRYLCGLLVGDEPLTDRAAAEANAHLYSTRISNKDEDGNAPHGRLLFHADGMWSEHPQELLSLYGESVEQPSVATVFASAVRAWEQLPDELRARVSGRNAVHATGQRDRGGFAADELLEPQRTAERSRATPIPTVHPRTGKPILYVSQMMTTHIEGTAARRKRASPRRAVRRPLRRREHLRTRLANRRSGRVGQPRDPARAGPGHPAGSRAQLAQGHRPRPDAALQASVERPTFDRRAAAG